jgi:hypothetical protein
MSNGQSTRYHAEIKVAIDGREARVNVFADTLNEIFLDLATICEQIPHPLANGAKREIANAELKAEQLRQNGRLPAHVEKKLGPKAPVCVNCGSTNTELIKWTDKETGEPKQAWKCQDCKQWLPKARKA